MRWWSRGPAQLSPLAALAAVQGAEARQLIPGGEAPVQPGRLSEAQRRRAHSTPGGPVYGFREVEVIY